MFSPYYKWARRKGDVDPMEHCALNVALYGKPRRWAMTERGAGSVTRSETTFAIGPSALRWEGDKLVIDVREIGAPLPRRMRGRIVVRPGQVFDTTFTLDAKARHRWRPIAPMARVEVDMEYPRLRWSGAGYFDHNNGDEPLEAGFRNWDWSRAHAGADTIIHYDARARDGGSCELSLRLTADGGVETLASKPVQPLPRTNVWRVARNARSSAGASPEVVKTLEDTPFYARSITRASHDGESLVGFHESLDLDRFCRTIVQGMLPFRMPRVSR